jgi:hypothetical protein
VKQLLLLGLLVIFLHARENPFFPSQGEEDLPFTSNDIQNFEPLKRAALSLPPHARVLQKVTVEYKNLDGSIESKTINVNNAVDWHLPIFISQSYVDTVSVLPKEQQEDSHSFVGEIAFAKFYEKKKSFKILTSDKLIRNFLLADPHRIVIDFQKDATLKSFIKKNPKSIFKTIRVGNHKGYYRVVLELDGAYRYQMNIENDGYSFKLF